MQLRRLRKEVNDEIDHIYWAGAKMRAHFNRLPKVLEGYLRRPVSFGIIMMIGLALRHSSCRPSSLRCPPILPSRPPTFLCLLCLSISAFQELQRRMCDGDVRSFEQIYDYMASAQFD